MQTSFTTEQLADPATARSEKILRACVHCGFCTATCPSYQVLGDELDSPRGRIYLIKDMLENGRAADAKLVKHIDRCLGCLACTTTCPSGVDYMHLLDHARAHIEATHKRPLPDRALRFILAKILPYPNRFRAAILGAWLARPVARFLPGRLRGMVDFAPKSLPPRARHEDAQTHAATAPKRLRVALLTGCAQRAVNTDISAAAIRLLTRHGAEVVIPKAMGCCGALTHHMGRGKDSHAFAAANIRAFTAEIAAGGLDAIVITTSGCGTTIKDYGIMFEGTALASDAARVAALARDITEVMAELGLNAATAPLPLRVGYHAACSLQHGQRITQAPKDLLRAAGFTVLEPADAHLCCGSAGTYNLLQPAIAAELGRRKLATLAAINPDVIAAGNIGCMMQIGAKTGIPVVHTAELLDWATGGPKPPQLHIAQG
ncbi:MAG: glycolate oxidase subunit GlcF [Paracoccaceae bacterium]